MKRSKSLQNNSFHKIRAEVSASGPNVIVRPLMKFSQSTFLVPRRANCFLSPLRHLRAVKTKRFVTFLPSGSAGADLCSRRLDTDAAGGFPTAKPGPPPPIRSIRVQFEITLFGFPGRKKCGLTGF
jgi:hypothetical protein